MSLKKLEFSLIEDAKAPVVTKNQTRIMQNKDIIGTILFKQKNRSLTINTNIQSSKQPAK